MTNTMFKKTIATVLTVATLATASFATSTSAHAGKKDFWRGAAVGAVTGAIIGSAHRPYREPDVVYVRPRPVYVEPRPVYVAPRGHGGSHVSWCHSRYRSYDSRSDTYQPYNGPRRFCNSPYN